MTTASSYFTGDKPMFGPDGFARKETPTCEGMPLRPSPFGGFLWLPSHFKPDHRMRHVHGEEALFACIVAAQGWIRSRGYVFAVQPDGDMLIQNPIEDSNCRYIDAINGSPDWLDAAKWVNEQVTK